MPRIEYTTYQFTKPPLPTQQNYILLKNILEQNPDHSLNPKSSFKETFLVEILTCGSMLGIAIAGGVLGGLISLIDSIKWLQLIGYLILLVSGLLLIGTFLRIPSLLLSILAYSAFVGDKWIYYNTLKKDIVKSGSYEEFLKRRKNK